MPSVTVNTTPTEIVPRRDRNSIGWVVRDVANVIARLVLCAVIFVASFLVGVCENVFFWLTNRWRESAPNPNPQSSSPSVRGELSRGIQHARKQAPEGTPLRGLFAAGLATAC